MRFSLRTGMVMLNSLASALALFGCQGIAWFGRAEHVEQIEKSLSFENAKLVSLRNVNGSVKITSWEKPEVLVEATKKVRATNEQKAQEYAQEVNIRIEKVDDVIEIITEHPEGRKPSFIKSVSVTYNVRMPKEANLDASSTNGSVNVDGIIGQTNVLQRRGQKQSLQPKVLADFLKLKAHVSTSAAMVFYLICGSCARKK